jgi:hypothetical protein
VSSPRKLAGLISVATATLAAAIGCTTSAPSPPPVADLARPPVIGETVQVLPGPGIPADAPLFQANNNLDVIQSGRSRFMAVRTSLIHFATPFTKIVVFRSADDGATWHTEAVIDRGRDMREPRFLDLAGHVFLYFFEAGTNPFAFQPGRVLAISRNDDGTWTEPVVVSPDDAVDWRTRTIDGVPYMIRYRGGEDSYSAGEAAMQVEMLTTTNGLDWVPVNPARPVVHTGGAGETDFAFAPDGRLWAVSRNEAGENGHFGSLLCTAPPEDITDWDCSYDARKFDSPLVFSHGGDIWMLARRQVANDGRYDLGYTSLPRDAQLLAYQLAYWVTPKRLALWHIDTARRSVDWVADLPSRGDTAFPGIVWTGPDSLVVYNYSSPIGGPDLPWVAGQLGPTNIYATPITLPS